MDEEESSDGVPDLEAQLYAQVHHEHVNSNLTTNQTLIPEDEKLIKDGGLERSVSFNSVYLNEEPVSTTRKSISANSGAKFMSLTQKNATVTATDKDQRENHLFENVPHQNNYDAECISTATTTSQRMETVIVSKGGISVGSQKSLATQNRPTDQRTFASKQVIRTVRQKSNSNTQKITNDTNKNVTEKNIKNGQNRETVLPLPNEKKTSFLFGSKKNSKAKENSKTKQLETIEIDSSGDDDNDDVVLVPTPPVPTYTVEDSDDDGDDTAAAAEQLSSKNVASLAIVETAMDSSDVQINYSNFLKPTLSTYIPEKRTLENSSRCTSPSSVFSTDDFIVHQDRQRLKNNLVADNDDNDLIMVDVNTSTDKCENSVTELLTNAAETPDLYVVEDKSSMPIRNFRVEQSQFRAVDVYESESDIPESIYGKGSKVVSKETVIRTINTTTDEDEQCVLEERNTNTKTKRLYKRRSSDSRKSCEGLINGEPESSDDDEVIVKPKNNRSNKIPYIEPGEAVERLKSNKPRRSSKNKPSDNETDSFIAAINSLAQGVERHQEDEEHSDIEETLTARQIAERVLEKKQNKRSVKTQATEPSPPSKIRRTMEHSTEEEESKDILDDLNKIMKVVDVLGKRHENKGFGSDFDCEVIENNIDSNNLVLGSSSEEELESAEISVNSMEKVENSNDGGGGGGDVIATKRQWDQKSPLYYIQSIKMCGNKAGIGWSDEQSRFYACSWNGETFDIENLWKTMSNNRKLWKVAPNDPFASAMKSPQNRVKCFNCCQYGHKKQRCPYPMRPKVCRVCGNAGHLDINCHKKCCLRCGTKTNSFVKSCNSCLFQNRLLCSLCKVRGHSLDTCPDKWRRYHSTIKPNQSPNSKISYNERIYCCNCGKRGHFGDECKKELPSGGYPKISSRVKSYDKSYENITSSNQSRGILCNLLYDPQFGSSQKFKLSELTKPRNYYGRFLNAVGLGYLLRKRRATPATSESPSQAKKKSKIVNSSSVSIETEETLHALEEADTSVMNNVTNKIQQSGIDSEVVESVQRNACSNRESTTIANDPSNKPIVLDSDSNYSFSEFDMGLPVKETAMTNKDLVTDNGQPEVDKEMALKEVQVDTGLAVNEEPEGTSEKKPEVQMGLPEKDPNELPTKDAEPKTTESKVVTITKSISARAPMGSTPDFIPLEGKDNEFTLDENSEISDNSLSPYDTDDDDENKINSNNNSFNNLPLVAKIYLTYQRGRYLSTPEGKQLLTKLSKETNVTSNLYWSTAGPVITLEGLSVDQDEFHRRLQILFKTANDSARRIKNDALQQMPKRVGVLIRFLIEHFDMLKGNLGNANDLHKRIKVLDLQNEPSKNSLKNADKLRRQLNMILIGQAGLQNGKIHLQSILQIFTTLQNDYKVDEIAPKFLRDELFLHWKKIFTSFRHENYDEIMQNYKKLNVKNYFVTLNIDVNKIGVIDVSLTAEQKERMSLPQARCDDGKTKANLQKSNKSSLASCKPTSNLDSLEKQLTAECIKSEKQEKNSAIKVDEVKEMKIKNDLASTSSKHSKSPINVPPFINPEQRSNLPKNFIVSTDTENSLKTTLFDIENSVYNKEPKSNSNSNKPSIFWSRESIDFLNKCLQIVSSKPDVADTLDRVLNRAHTGLLSCNDYIALKKCCDKLL